MEGTTATHIVIDDFASDRLIAAAAAEWPPPEWPGWHVYRSDAQVKRASRWPLGQLPPACAALLLEIAKLPTHWNVAGFPDLSLHGAGLHELPAGGFVGRHRDAARHAVFGWTRETSAVLFLGDAGGRLRLPDAVIAPQANRLAVFRTQDCWHEVEPSDQTRRTLALFFYSHETVESDRTSAEFAQ